MEATNVLSRDDGVPMLNEANELIAILTTIVRKTKGN
jgi:hypothetical protein